MSIKQRQRLDHIVPTIDSHNVWMAEGLLAEDDSQLFIPPFIKTLAAVTDHLEVVAPAPKRYMENNKRHDAVTVTRHVKAKVNQAHT